MKTQFSKTHIVDALRYLRSIFIIIFAAIAPISHADGIKVNVTITGFLEKEASIYIKNEKSFPRVVRVNVSNQDDKETIVATAITTVPANGDSLQKVKPMEGKRFSGGWYWEYVHGVGDLTKAVEPSGFKIPISDETPASVCQYPHGVDPAIDFCAPIGTKVYAAKSGMVIWTVDKFGNGGNDRSFFDKANLVEIIHEDGSRALYTHLDKGSIGVKEGDKVVQGQYLGNIGLSGQTSGPHLHFHVVKLNSDFKDEFVVPQFSGDDGKPLNIKAGNIVSRNSSTQAPQIAARQPEPAPKPQSKIVCGEVPGDENKKAIDCLSKGQLDQAIVYLTAHTKKNPNDSLALARLATQYTHLGRHEEAIPAYKNAIKKNWISFDFASLYARSLFATGEKEEAIKWNKRALTLAPDCTGCRQELASQLREMGRIREALKLLTDYNETLKSKGKPTQFQGIIMLLEDDMSEAKK